MADTHNNCLVCHQSPCTCAIARPTPAAPAADEVREARERLNDKAMNCPVNQYAHCSRQKDMRIILAALDRAQGEATEETRRKEHYRQAFLRSEAQLVDQSKQQRCINSLTIEADALRAENARLTEELKGIGIAQYRRLESQNAAQAEQIKLLKDEQSCVPQAVRAWFVGQWKIKEASHD